MSYILEALKKSQQERELGHVPTLAAEPFAKQKHPSRGNPWVVTAFFLAVVAVVIALYAALGDRYTWQQAPQSAATSPPQELSTPASPASPSMPQPQSRIVTAPDTLPRPGPHSSVTEPATPDAGSFPAPPYNEDYAYPYPAQAPYPDDAWDDMPPEPDAWVSDEDPTRAAAEAPHDPAIPPDLHRDIEAFKRQALQDQYGMTPEALEPPPRPSTRRPPPTTQASGSHLGVDQAAAPPRAGAPDPVVREERLPDQVLERLPERTVTVHVYSDDPRKRFVIIASRKMIEGDRTPQGLVVEEIHPNGVVFRFDKHRFFRPR